MSCFEEITLQCDIQEDSWITTTQFLNGLKLEIKKVISMYSSSFIEETYYKALEVETSLGYQIWFLAS